MESIEERRARLTHNTQVYRQRHPERVALGYKAVYLSRRRRAFEKLGGAFCVNCGCDILEFLELNHKNGGGSKEFKVIGNHIIEKIINGQRDIADYEVLCRVCNALDHLKRKNADAARAYDISWQNFTGKQAAKL